MFKGIKEILKYKDLLMMLCFRDIRIRYKQAVMGFVWAIFMPIIAVAAGLLIKKAMAVVSGQYIEWLGIISISVKVLPWTFFISSVRFSVQSLVGNSALVTKIYFPKAVLPLASIMACLFDFFIGAIVLILALTLAQLGMSIYILWLPWLLLMLILFTAGLGLFLAAANLFYRDVRYVVEIILMFGIFFTPVFYDAQNFGNWRPLLLINPVGSILESLNQVVVLKQSPDFLWLCYASVVSICIFIFGVNMFQNKQQLFAENI
jgi:ABC-type polysaccharide/polyol phosphate export permease